MYYIYTVLYIYPILKYYIFFMKEQFVENATFAKLPFSWWNVFTSQKARKQLFPVIGQFD